MIQEKQILIKENKEVIIRAINAYLDKIYNLSETFFNNDDTLKDGLKRDEKVETFIKNLKSRQAIIFEDIRKKIINDNFDLSHKEIAYINSSLIYIFGCWEEQIKNLTQAKNEITELIKKLIIKDN